MKSGSNIKPLALESAGDWRWFVNYNVKEITREEGVYYEYEQVLVDKLDYGLIVSAIIRERYTLDNEMSVQRKGIADSGNAEFIEYNAFAESVKAMVKEFLTQKK
jgi:hypothetical protein